MDYALLESVIFEKLKTGLDSSLYYHGFKHTKQVIENVIEISENENVTGKDLELIKIAALFHDVGFIKSNINHEEIGCEFARELLPDYKLSDFEIDLICNMILATKIPQSPKTKSEMILADADLMYLGTEKYEKIAHKLFKEIKESDHELSLQEWVNVQINFLNQHSYFTQYCQNKYSATKIANLNKIISENTSK